MKNSTTWFNLNPGFKPGRRWKVFNAFFRRSTERTWWGFGVLQMGKRHLFFVGNVGISILFFGTTE